MTEINVHLYKSYFYIASLNKRKYTFTQFDCLLKTYKNVAYDYKMKYGI